MTHENKNDTNDSNGANEESTEPQAAEGTPAPSPATPPASDGGDLKPDEKTMGMLAHLLGIITWFVGPLIIWLIKKDESEFVNDQGKEAVNFQITVGIAYVLCMIPTCFTGGLLVCIMVLPWIGSVVFGILAGVAANKGERYRYPVSIRLIK